MKDILKQWKSDLQAIKEEKRLEKKKRRKNTKKKIGIGTSELMGTSQSIYTRNNRRWKQK
ncbi:hypothetical protein JDS87_23770 [Bacillus cereus]|uniref:hypothetical protein n=1 Tax=Bacillus cereus TaxID=1396 RepID=UPI0018F7C152|nr:hypothetical protein [Bacillus cereus]MBJ8054885.1 hypothetical protein [Bacillus cereus]